MTMACIFIIRLLISFFEFIFSLAVVKVFNVHKVTYSDEDGLMCTNPTLLVTWQFRPGSNTSQRVTGSGRKRVQMLADSLDLINSGECVSEYAKINIFQEENNEETQPSKISKLGVAIPI